MGGVGRGANSLINSLSGPVFAGTARSILGSTLHWAHNLRCAVPQQVHRGRVPDAPAAPNVLVNFVTDIKVINQPITKQSSTE